MRYYIFWIPTVNTAIAGLSLISPWQIDLILYNITESIYVCNRFVTNHNIISKRRFYESMYHSGLQYAYRLGFDKYVLCCTAGGRLRGMVSGELRFLQICQWGTGTNSSELSRSGCTDRNARELKLSAILRRSTFTRLLLSKSILYTDVKVWRSQRRERL